MKQTADMVDSGQSTACQFLAQKQLHLQDIWKAECSCCDKKWGKNVMSVFVAPVHRSNQGSSPSAFENWKQYYMFQGWSLSDPSAIILDAPMTLLWALQQSPIWLPNSKHHHDKIIHYLGAQKELDQWPVFLELMRLMPCTSLQISFISPDVPSNLDGKCKIFTKQQGSNELTDAVQTASTSSDCEAVLASDAAMQDSKYSFSHGGQKQFSCEPYAPRDDTNNMHPVVWSAESQHPAAKGAAQLAQPVKSAETISQTLQLSFHTGCYHDVATQIHQESGRPDLVFGANAGLAAYPSWVPTLQLLSQPGAPASIFTDFCEEAAFQGMRVMQAVAQGPMQWMPITLNPFRKPLSCQGRDNNLPSYSNAFIFGMAPIAEEHE